MFKYSAKKSACQEQTTWIFLYTNSTNIRTEYRTILSKLYI